MKKIVQGLSFWLKGLAKREKLCYTNTCTNLPVAQLDSASDSDSEGQRFESVRVGQTKKGACPPFCLVYLIGTEKCNATRSVCKGSESVRVGQ